MFQIMSARWDAIVIGAGVGGLSAAARLVQAGLRVLVLEKSPHVGGTAYVYTRKGFTFPMGPLGFSTTGFVRDTLRMFDHREDMAFHRVHYRVRAFGVDECISRPFQELKGRMAKRFPEDSAGIVQFFDDMDEILSALQTPDEDHSRAILEEAEKTSAHAYLQERITDWRLRRIAGSLGTREPYTGLPLLAAMWALMSKEGIWYPKGGMRSFCDRLAAAITHGAARNGGAGKIDLGARVAGIRLSKGKALGVTLADGTTINAPKIVSNADFKTTFVDLIEPGAVPRSWRNKVKQAKQTNSVFQVCLGVDTEKANLAAFSKASRIILKEALTWGADEPPLDWGSQALSPEDFATLELEISLWSKEDETLAPPGGAVMVLRTEADHKHFSRYRSMPTQRTAGYHSYKIRLAKALISRTARLVPGIEEAIQVWDIATPLTFEERGGRSDGAVAGWSWDFNDNPGKPVELVRTPISGLYMAGYQAYSALFMGGVPTAISSGLAAAQALLEGAPPVDELRIPGH